MECAAASGSMTRIQNGSVQGVHLTERAIDQLLLLMFADDIVLVAESLEDLQQMANVLAEHARKWRYQINLKKTKYMCFSQPPSNQQQHAASTSQLVWDGGQLIDKVASYKYLGIHLSETLD